MCFSTGAAGAFLSSQLLRAPIFLCHPDEGISQRHPDAAEPDGAVPAAGTPLPMPTFQYYSTHIQRDDVCPIVQPTRPEEHRNHQDTRRPQTAFEI